MKYFLFLLFIFSCTGCQSNYLGVCNYNCRKNLTMCKNVAKQDNERTNCLATFEKCTLACIQVK